MVLERLFGSRDPGFDFDNPKAKYGVDPDEYDCFGCRALGMQPNFPDGLISYYFLGWTNLGAGSQYDPDIWLLWS